MPCNVVVYDDGRGGSCVTSVDPRITMAAGKVELKGLAEEIAGKLRSALEKI